MFRIMQGQRKVRVNQVTIINMQNHFSNVTVFFVFFNGTANKITFIKLVS